VRQTGAEEGIKRGMCLLRKSPLAGAVAPSLSREAS
jgi:hypothetical protein